MYHLTRRAIGSLLLVLTIMGALFFLVAGTFAYWQAWTFLAVFGACDVVLTGYLLRRDPKLLERRLSGGPFAERQTSERLIMSLASIEFVALLVIPALDQRFGWSSVPWYMAIIGNGVVVLGLGMVFLVFRANTFAAATIAVAADQTVISSGPYMLVRHPMYSGSLLYLLGMPVALGSWWGLCAVLPLLLTIVWRLLDEEAFLTQHLAGYPAYKRAVRYRLIPLVW